MSAGLVALVTAIYFCASAIELFHRRFDSALILGGYAIANIGLIWGLAR